MVFILDVRIVACLYLQDGVFSGLPPPLPMMKLVSVHGAPDAGSLTS